MGTPYHVTWTSTWGAGWTQLAPFQPDHLPYFIAYSATTGQVHFDQRHKPPDMLPSITGFDILWQSVWGKGWTRLMPFALNDKPQLLAYNAATGEVHFDRLHDDAKGFDILWQSTWGKGWTHFMPFVLNAKPGFLAYNAATGEVHFDRIHDDGKGFDILWQRHLGQGLDALHAICPQR